MRSRPPLRNGASSYFGQLNAGKKSVVLDLKTPAPWRPRAGLPGGADILVENYRPGVMRRLGLDYAVLGNVNPRLIYCSISGYGQTGPSADLPAYAPVIHAASGYDLAHLAYQKGRTSPDNCGIYVADVLAGTYAFGAILGAPPAPRNGQGQLIDVSMLESMLTLTLTETPGGAVRGAAAPAGRSSDRWRPPTATSAWRWPASGRSRAWRQRPAGRTGSPTRASPNTSTGAPTGAPDGRARAVVRRASPAPSAWRCSTATRVPAAAYRTVREAMADPQLAHRGAFGEVRDAGGSSRHSTRPSACRPRRPRWDRTHRRSASTPATCSAHWA